jgi:DNA-binding response OmpR family regulator
LKLNRSTENISILAVDADPLLRDRYMHFLTQHGCSVVVAGDTESMDHALLEQRFDLMILDVMLSGFEILLRLRSQKSKLPVIVVSALVG